MDVSTNTIFSHGGEQGLSTLLEGEVLVCMGKMTGNDLQIFKVFYQK